MVMKRREAIKMGSAALLSTSFLYLLESCKSQTRTEWNPVFLSNDHALLVSSLVDTILPKTNTPGGLDVKADMFLDLVFKKMYTPEAQKALMADMKAFNETCISKYGKVFHQLNATQKEACLRDEEKSSPKFAGQVWGTAVGPQQPVGFYRSIKSMSIWAYCTSEAIGKNVLNYDPLPGAYQGCIPMTDVGKVWSL